jgi:hypothetical protein
MNISRRLVPLAFAASLMGCGKPTSHKPVPAPSASGSAFAAKPEPLVPPEKCVPPSARSIEKELPRFFANIDISSPGLGQEMVAIFAKPVSIGKIDEGFSGDKLGETRLIVGMIYQEKGYYVCGKGKADLNFEPRPGIGNGPFGPVLVNLFVPWSKDGTHFEKSEARQMLGLVEEAISSTTSDPTRLDQLRKVQSYLSQLLEISDYLDCRINQP